MVAQPCMKESFTNMPKYQNFVALRTIDDAHVDPRIVPEYHCLCRRDTKELVFERCFRRRQCMKIDNLLIFYSISFVAVTRDLGILPAKMHVI